jgi:hypothetical protein
MMALTDEQKAILKSERRQRRTYAAWLDYHGISIGCSRETAVIRRMFPAIIREYRAIADVADKMLKDGACSAEQWDALVGHIKRSDAHALAVARTLDEIIQSRSSPLVKDNQA